MNLQSTAKQAGPRLSAVPRYLSAVLSQGMVSGFHFVLNLMLVRILPIADFGVFALTFVMAIMASSVSNALVSTPLSIYAPSAIGKLERIRIESMLTTILTLLLSSALALGILISLRISSPEIDFRVLIASLGFVITYLARQYSRSFGYSRFDVISVLYGDIAYVVSGIIMFSLLIHIGTELTSIEVFTVLTVANALAILVEVGRLPEPVNLLSIRRALLEYLPIWNQSRWALIGAVTTVLVSQAHTFIVSSLKNPAAYAPLAAGFVLFGPVRVIFSTLQNVMKPEMSLAIAENRADDARTQMIVASAISMLAVVGLVILTQLVWPILSQWLYNSQYADEPMREIVMLWAAVTLVAAMQNGPFAALQSLRAFRSLAVCTVYGSAISLILVAFLLYQAPIHWSIVGILMAESFVAIWVVQLVLKRFYTLRTRGSTAIS